MKLTVTGIDKIAVIGAGSWGTAVANMLSAAGRPAMLWARDESVSQYINRRHMNPRYLVNVHLAPDLKVTSDLEEAVGRAEIICLAVPAQSMRSVVEKIAVRLSLPAVLVSLTKGLEADSMLRMSQVIEESGGGAEVAVLSGPNHAEEVILSVPSATVVAARSPETARLLQDIFMTPFFRVYTNKDMVGVELAAATKNVIAVAAGISDGLGYGDNAKASLMTRGLAEMTRLGGAMGARSSTYAGLAGVGDLIATCTSRHSRNRGVGERLAKGQSVEDAQAEMGMVAEGVATVRAVRALAEGHGLEMPISRSVYEIIYENKDPRKCVRELMERGPAQEE